MRLGCSHGSPCCSVLASWQLLVVLRCIVVYATSGPHANSSKPTRDHKDKAQNKYFEGPSSYHNVAVVPLLVVALLLLIAC